MISRHYILFFTFILCVFFGSMLVLNLWYQLRFLEYFDILLSHLLSDDSDLFLQYFSKGLLFFIHLVTELRAISALQQRAAVHESLFIVCQTNDLVA